MISERAARFEEEAAKVAKETTSAQGLKRRPILMKRAYPPPPGMEGVGDPWKVHVFNTFFLSKLMDMGYEKSKLNKWTKKVSIAPAVPSITGQPC
jgi:sentrin-specific protease 1